MLSDKLIVSVNLLTALCASLKLFIICLSLKCFTGTSVLVVDEDDDSVGEEGLWGVEGGENMGGGGWQVERRE
jgi:hypothetical protein